MANRLRASLFPAIAHPICREGAEMAMFMRALSTKGKEEEVEQHRVRVPRTAVPCK